MILIYILYFAYHLIISCHAFNEVTEFEKILSEEDNLLVLFTEECCSCTECVEYEAMLGTMSKTLEEMGLLIAKIKGEELKSRFGIKETPSLIYLRNSVPILYEGKLDTEEIYWFSQENREPYTKVLNDETFEHLTQAATGSTTGDWLVAFYKDSCINTMALYTNLDGVASHLKARVNVAIVNQDDSPETTKRFKIKNCPEVMFFHHGRMYRTVWGAASSLKLFAERLYKEHKAESIPVPQTYFDKLVEHFASFHLVSITFAFIAFVTIVIFAMLRSTKPKSE